MIPYLLPENRQLAGDYLSRVFKVVAQIIYGLQYPIEVDDNLTEKFMPYVDYEEQRIKRNLELIKYNIDALYTIPAVVGGKIEKVWTCFQLPTVRIQSAD